jgi:TetR/AcrR family transcriptional regulator, transcriptional repressor for nem operon
MKVTREQAALNRERILEAAARLFRERGFDGVGVADIMKAAGLTHGGFYGNFASKEDLMAQACAHALSKSLDNWDTTIERAKRDPLTAVTHAYLSARHRDQPGQGCVLAALGPDTYRQGAPVRRTFTAGVRSLVDLIAGLLPGTSPTRKRKQAIASFAGMVGAIVLARAVDDRELSNEILGAVAASIDEASIDEA